MTIGSPVDLTDFTANGDLNGSSEYFNLSFNAGVLDFNQLKTGEQCGGMDPVNNNPSGSIVVIDIGSGTPGFTFSGTTSSEVDDLNGCSNGVDLSFNVTSFIPTERQTDSDGIPDHMDPDSDDDGCLDVLEAGFTDSDLNGELDGSGINADGTVAGASDGYTGNNGSTTDATDQACPIDCQGVPSGPIMPGTPCDDNDLTTGNDVYQSDCTCAGALYDCLGIAGGNTLPGQACNDSDPTTGNDVYQSGLLVCWSANRL